MLSFDFSSKIKLKNKVVLKYFRKILLNKYSFVIVAFLIYIIFFDENNWIKKHQRSQEIKQLEIEYQYYINEMEQNKETINKLNNDTVFLEKYAREHYYMKRPNEDVFILK